VALCEDGVIDVGHLNLPRLPRTAVPGPGCEATARTAATREADPETAESDSEPEAPLKAAELKVIRDSLVRHSWNISRTAAALDMSRNTLYRKIRRHGIVPG
jgi:transcriptional regulator of acetoin/glycerol metabolism